MFRQRSSAQSVSTEATEEQDDVPQPLRVQMQELEEWAINNRRDARNDTIAFWILKIPAMVTAAAAGGFAYYKTPGVSVIASGIATLCILIDSVLPRGVLRNTHLRAFHDIRILTTNMAFKWRTRLPDAPVQNVARTIIIEAEQERERIATYVRDAETSLNPSQEILRK